jgi:toxin ParE1/3/4
LQIRRTTASKKDYETIWDFIAQDNADAADQLLLHFDERLERLAESPFMGRAIDALAPSLRCSPVGNYVLFYRPDITGIQLIRVLHARRDITPEFFDSLE